MKEVIDMAATSPDIVLRHAYSPPGSRSKGHAGYVGYLGRDTLKAPSSEADFLDYMANPSKGARLYAADGKPLSKADTAAVKAEMKAREEQGCPLYEDVYSFTEDALRRTGVVSADGQVNEQRLLAAVRRGHENLLRREDVSNPLTTYAVHYDKRERGLHVLWSPTK